MNFHENWFEHCTNRNNTIYIGFYFYAFNPLNPEIHLINI
jgi:hypothetical protein